MVPPMAVHRGLGRSLWLSVMLPELVVVHQVLRKNQELLVMLPELVAAHQVLRKNQELLVMLPELVMVELQVPCRSQSQADRGYSVLAVPQELDVPALAVPQELDVPALAVPQELGVHELDVLGVRELDAQSQTLVEQR